ncbi:MAG: hypothetical protein EPN21_06250 [Methylococcaceae bacterium]|nr:MAG: hypothetical protein EPN21_06250 [Methylococcaceae bacterium]
MLLAETHVGKVITCQVTYVDGSNSTENLTTSTYTPVSHKPVFTMKVNGATVAAGTTVKLGDVCTMSVTDPDGIASSVTFKWYSGAGVTFSNTSSVTIVDTMLQAASFYMHGYARWTDSVGTDELVGGYLIVPAKGK